jgi:mannose-6-phosphate isomerase-like protein (cupin superfamily)
LTARSPRKTLAGVTPRKQFTVFGESVEVLTAGSETDFAMSAIVQTVPPGGGPPPHWHDREDETFMTLDGRFELFDGQRWTELPKGRSAFAPRGQVHSFRNCGDEVGRILCVATPGYLDEYLAAIAPIGMPADMAKLIEISDRYGVHFVGP